MGSLSLSLSPHLLCRAACNKSHHALHWPALSLSLHGASVRSGRGGVGQFSERGGGGGDGVERPCTPRSARKHTRMSERAYRLARGGKPGAATAQVGDHSVVMGRRKTDRGSGRAGGRADGLTG